MKILSHSYRVQTHSRAFIAGYQDSKYTERKKLIRFPRKIKTYPVVTAENTRSYIKPTIFKKPDLSLVHSETNNLANRINTMTNVWNVLTTTKEMYKDKKIKFGQKQSSGGNL